MTNIIEQAERAINRSEGAMDVSPRVVIDMYQALTALIRAISEPGPMGSIYEIERAIPSARAAIAQAEGRS